VAANDRPRIARDALLIVVVAAASVLPWLGQERHLSSREDWHAEVARELVVRDAWAVPTKLFELYEHKPPVLHAAAAALFRATGAPSYGLARLPSALAAILAALCAYGLGRILFDRRTALLAALGLVGMQGFAHMARVARPDMILGFAVALACLGLARAGLASRGARGAAWMALAGLASGLGVVTKGPYGLLFPLLFIALAPSRTERLRRPRPALWAWFAVGLVAAVAVWAVPAWQYDGGEHLRRVVLQPNLTTGSSHHARPVWYYAGPLLATTLPLGLLLPALVLDIRRRGVGPALLAALAMLCVLSLVPGKRNHYLVPVYPFLALALGRAALAVAERRGWVRRAAYTLVALGAVAPVVYHGAVTRFTQPPVDERIALARAVLAHAPPDAPIVGFGGVAEVIAFVGERDTVRGPTGAETAAQLLRDADEPAYALVRDDLLEVLRAAAADLVFLPTGVEGAVGRRRVTFRLYAVTTR
jgi:4-amino-4-deoxy-L-arabinose transferase-like glycosyltransferase